MVTFNIRSLLDEVVSQFAEGARRKNVNLVVQVSADVPQLVAGHSWHLCQALTNLVDNALQLTETGEIYVTVRAFEPEPVEEGAVHLFCEVRDTGAGISPEVQARIFRHMFASEDCDWLCVEAESRLRLTRKLVELMGCHLALVSREGVGSTFWFKVRMKKVAQVTAALPPTADAGPSPHQGEVGIAESLGIIKGEKGTVLDEHVINGIRALERGAPNLLASLADRFLAESPRHLDTIRSAFRRKAWEELRYSAHALKSSSALLGARALADLCQNLETGGLNGGMPDAEMLLGRVEAELTRVCNALSALGG